eukprot:6487644-Amphidinium_carterae.1
MFRQNRGAAPHLTQHPLCYSHSRRLGLLRLGNERELSQVHQRGQASDVARHLGKTHAEAQRQTMDGIEIAG